MAAPQIVAPPQSRRPLRLRLGRAPGQDRLDGAWWPYSRDLESEMSDLVRQFPLTDGHISRVVYSRPDWDTAPHTLTVEQSVITVDAFPRDDTHVLSVDLSDGGRLTLLVVPPDFTPGQGEEALLAASSEAYAHSAASLLDEVGAHPDVDPRDHWTDEGGSWQSDDLIGRPDH
jgi:hypothetical protein